MTMLPRTTGVFNRRGLKVNGLRYKCEGYTEEYLKGGTCTVAYDPDNVSCVWLLKNGKYIKFDLIESRFRNKTLSEVESVNTRIKELNSADEDKIIQAEIDLSKHISAIGSISKRLHKVGVKESEDI